ncbi:uncharacterized protein LOC107365878 isoform X2 [Tetranychus urticae]|uniref:uncharacterized protein LOC107365878 isoform X2 n=1 Tax=Tetranychus urticae TaxID=32264 RepID=UPI00077C054F|nr:uncharacterized protein LOC107365878 isoform X2 [Tetranychus urticae]
MSDTNKTSNTKPINNVTNGIKSDGKSVASDLKNSKQQQQRVARKSISIVKTTAKPLTNAEPATKVDRKGSKDKIIGSVNNSIVGLVDKTDPTVDKVDEDTKKDVNKEPAETTSKNLPDDCVDKPSVNQSEVQVIDPNATKKPGINNVDKVSTRSNVKPTPVPVLTKKPGTNNAVKKGETKAKPAKPGPEKFIELCKKGAWIRVLELMDEYPSENNNIGLSSVDPVSGYSPIMFAVKSSRIDVIEKMIKYGFHVNIQAQDGLTALHLAAQSGKDELIRILLTAKADPMIPGGAKKEYPIHILIRKVKGPNSGPISSLLKACPEEMRLATDLEGYIPLLYAVEMQNTGLVRELLSVKPKLQLDVKRKKFGDTAVHIATRKRDIEMFRVLLEYGANVNAQNRDGQTPLHLVACDSEDNWIKFLQSHSADSNICDAQDRTPLFLIVEKGLARRVDYMIEKFGASINCRPMDGKTLVHAAVKSKTVELPLSFIKKGIAIKTPDRNGSRVIHTAADYGHVDLIKNLLSRGEDVDAQNNDGYTPLHVAAKSGRDDIAEILIANRASVDIVASNGSETPLHLACRSSNGTNCARLLIKSGAKINSANKAGMTPIMIAAESGNLSTLNLLLDHQVNIDLVNDYSENSLHIAVRSCHYKIAETLINTIKEWRTDKGLETYVNLQNKIGETCLHYVASLDKGKLTDQAEDRGLTKLLLDSGGSIMIGNFDTKETPVHYCCRYGSIGALEEIIHAKSATDFMLLVNSPSKYGLTPILHACRSGHADIIKLLLQQYARTDVFDEKGQACLHLAAELGHEAVVDILLENKATVGVRNKQGMTPLHIASKNGFTSMVKSLITRYQAQIDVVTLNKQTPLHMATESGALETCAALLELGANMNAVDGHNQTPLHLAAESNHSEVFKLFLEKNPNLISSVNGSGLTCAHIAASKGSVSVIEEMLKFDKQSVIKSKIPGTEATALHEAAAKGFAEVVKILVEAGGSAQDEDKDGMTPLHLAARHGHIEVFRVLKDFVDLKMVSKRNGLTALHIAASYGQSDFVIELLSNVPGGIPSVKGSIGPNEEYGVTPLHLASKNGHESVVRLLMNSTGVQVNAQTKIHESIPMHYAAEGGHMIVAGLLISRSSDSLTKPDKHGKTSLHLAAAQGHLNMVSMLLGQGAEINALDKEEWTPLHHASKCGSLPVVKLLIESGADTDAVNNKGKNAIYLATGSSHLTVLSYLVKIPHDSLNLIEDKSFLLDLMFCSKNHENKPIEEFIINSESPIYVAVKLARAFETLANRDKDKSRDLLAASSYCDNIAIELLNIISTNYGISSLLRATDNRSIEFLDVLIEFERKMVTSQHAVQKYLSKVWLGNLQWTSTRFTIFFITLLLFPPLWVVVSTPIGHKLHSIPVIKFLSFLTAHIYFIIVLSSVLLFPPLTIAYYECCLPQWNEWLLFIWIIGLLFSEIVNPRDRSGLGNIKMIILVFCFIGVIMHLSVFVLNFLIDEHDFLLDEPWFTRRSDILFMRNQIWAWAMLFSFIDFLNFLTVHPLFGPWGVIIVELLGDLIKFVSVLMLFIAGFTLHICAIYQPVYQSHVNASFSSHGTTFMEPAKTGEILLWALFGLVQLEELPAKHLNPSFSQRTMKAIFGIYMLLSIVVLINLLIAMMSNTYQRIEDQSDIEWKFGRAKLIQNMNRTLPTPSPINLILGLPLLLQRRSNRKKQDKVADMRLKSARTITSRRNSADTVDTKQSSIRRGSKASILTAKTLLLDGFDRQAKTVYNVVNWQTVVRKYHETLGLIKPTEEADDTIDS